MGYRNVDRVGTYGDEYPGVNKAVVLDPTPPAPNQPQGQPAPAATAPGQSPPAQAQPAQPNPTQPAVSAPQATPAPATQGAKPGTAPADAEDKELDTMLDKGDIEKVKTVKVADNTFIRVYAKKVRAAPPAPGPVQPAQPVQAQQSVQAAPKPAQP